MKYFLNWPEKGINNIIIETSLWSEATIKQSNEKLEAVKEKDPFYLVLDENGNRKKLYLKGLKLNFKPKGIIDDEQKLLTREFAEYEYFLAFLPLVLIAIGGMLGGALGMIGMLINMEILRNNKKGLKRVFLVIGFTILIFISFNLFLFQNFIIIFY